MTWVLAGCRGESLAPPGPPYLAIVTRLDVPKGVDPGRTYAYHVTELSGTLGIDTTIFAAPTDTVILSLPPATYRVRADGLPSYCLQRDGAEQFVLLPRDANTGIARYFVICRAPLALELATDGPRPDTDYYVRLNGVGATDRLIAVGANDTVVVDSLPPGRYTAELGGVAPNCLLAAVGSERQEVDVGERGGNRVTFRVRCSDPSRRPALLDIVAGHDGGGVAFAFRAADPDRDIERFHFDLTDCAGRSVLPGGGRLRRGLSSGRTAFADTALVIGAYELRLDPAALDGRCVALRVEDEQGNSSEWRQRALVAPGSAASPVVVSFGRTFEGFTRMNVQLAVDDPDGDLVGLFGLLRLRDGSLGAPDGVPDIGAFNASGYLTPPLPSVPLGNGRPELGAYEAILVYLIDRLGHVRRAELPVF